MGLTKTILRWLLRKLYKVEVTGMEHFEAAGERVLIVANHTSFLDAVLLATFLPGELTFAVNTQVAATPWLRPFLAWVRIFPMDPTNPLALKSLIRLVKSGRKAVIFPEGRITVTGSLMKIYDGPGMVADKAGAAVLPVRIDGAQFTPFSRLRGRVRLRWFPRIRLTVLPARTIPVPANVDARDRRRYAGQVLGDIMTEMVFATSNYRRTLFEALLDAQDIHGRRHVMLEDLQRKPLRYAGLVTGALLLGERLAPHTEAQENVGLLLPSTAGAVTVFMALNAYGRVPAMLNYSLGAGAVASACDTADIGTVITSRRFLEAANLQEMAEHLGQRAALIYLEDIHASITPGDRLRALLLSRFARRIYARRCHKCTPEQPAVVLFTSGSEGAPKGVVLSHANLLANAAQIASRVDFTSQDIILNALPLFHSFGLSAGTLLPLLSGMKTFLYPSPLHYRVVPEIAYDINATILFGTNTFLNGYARHAHPYDFYSTRYVFAGAEKLQEQTRQLWSERFGVRIFEGYGATETSPVLATNTPMESSPGTVGRFLPGIAYRLEPVPGISEGGRLYVRGPNVMLGYLLARQPGRLQPTESVLGAGWYDTGDIVHVDAQGYVRICGRAKRFAKVAGEMISLALVEELCTEVWPGFQHAAVSVRDEQKGERVVLITSHTGIKRKDLVEAVKGRALNELHAPRDIVVVSALPLLGSGKTDYAALAALAEQEVGA